MADDTDSAVGQVFCVKKWIKQHGQGCFAEL